jgi:hypothetical protein
MFETAVVDALSSNKVSVALLKADSETLDVVRTRSLLKRLVYIRAGRSGIDCRFLNTNPFRLQSGACDNDKLVLGCGHGRLTKTDLACVFLQIVEDCTQAGQVVALCDESRAPSLEDLNVIFFPFETSGFREVFYYVHQ